MIRDKYILERINFYKTLMVMSKTSVLNEAKARGLKVKSTSTKGVIIQKILDNEYPY